MSVSRRHIFPLAGLAAIGVTQPSEARAPATDNVGQALTISIRHTYAGIGWEVFTPDPEYTARWRPGMAIAYRWMPLGEFLAEIEKECGIASA